MSDAVEPPSDCPVCLGQYECAWPATGQHFPADGSVVRRKRARPPAPMRYEPRHAQEPPSSRPARDGGPGVNAPTERRS